MDAKAINERIDGYRASREEWLRRRQAALAQADECRAMADKCAGAIEALQDLIPAKPIEEVIPDIKVV